MSTDSSWYSPNVKSDGAAGAAVKKRLQELLGADQPLGALGELLKKFAAITGDDDPDLPKKCTIVCCGDHGVAEMNVSAYPPSTTVQMTANYLISRGTTANALSNFSGADLQ